jgi:6-pyruvoyltetrahydropterin/6-carboxytetrahydropterin synthase
MHELHVTATFSAAHRLPGYDGACARVHGHNYRVTVFVRCDRVDAVGLGIDFRVLRGHVRETLAALDHRDLNEVDAFRATPPSAEHIARYVFEDLVRRLAGIPARLHRVTVSENDDSGATYWASPPG